MLALLVAACGGNNTASHSAASSSRHATPSPPASPASGPPAPVSSPLGVLVGSQAAGSYTISLVGIDGKVVATAEASSPPVTSCGNIAAAPYPLPVSDSNSRVYFMDAQGAIHYLGPAGDTGNATSVPAPTSSRRSTFAVSPDDQRIAVVTATYTTTQAATKLYVEDLNGGGHRVDLFSETGSRSLWAVGWHGSNNLVVAVVPSCTQGGGPFCCGMQELHVVDPATATRRFTLGTWATCPIAGPPSPGGVMCINGPTFTSGKFLNWTAGTVRTVALNNPAALFVSPDGQTVALADPTGTQFAVGASHPPQVGDVRSGSTVAVAAAGDCSGRLPGGL